MADSVDRVFSHALQTVKRIPSVGSSRPPDDARLKLYGLYKQSTEGDVKGIVGRPQSESAQGGSGVSELQKWEAWRANQGLSRTEAKRRYIATLIETMHEYATSTPAARELVTELEFVWDQIKAVSVSPSEANPVHSPYAGPAPQFDRSNNNQRILSGLNTSGLQVLNPLSDSDGAHYIDSPDYDGGGFESPSPRDMRWKKRIEQAIGKAVVEIAALRETLEMTKADGRPGTGRLRPWALGLAWAIARHIIVDSILVAILLIWARKRSPVIDQVLWLLWSRLRSDFAHLRRYAVWKKPK